MKASSINSEEIVSVKERHPECKSMRALKGIRFTGRGFAASWSLKSVYVAVLLKVYYVCERLLPKKQSVHERGVRVCRSQLEVVPRNGTGSRPLSSISAGGSLGRGSRALHLQHHQSSLSALHMASSHSNTVDRRRSSLRVMLKYSPLSISLSLSLTLLLSHYPLS